MDTLGSNPGSATLQPRGLGQIPDIFCASDITSEGGDLTVFMPRGCCEG